MADFPFMPLYVADYLADTTHLSTEAHGAYLLLLMVLWKSGGELPNDDKILARIVRCTPAKWERLKGEVLEFFQIVENKIFHNRITQEIQKAKNLTEVRSTVGKQGVEAKRLKSQEPPQAIASDLLKQTGQQTPSKPLPSHISHLTKENSTTILPVSTTVAELSLVDLEKVLRKAAGWEREPAPGLFITGPIQAVIAAGANLERDVLPVVSAIASKANSRTSWKFFIPAIRSAMNDRIAAGRPLEGKSELDRASKRAAALKLIEAHNQAGKTN